MTQLRRILLLVLLLVAFAGALLLSPEDLALDVLRPSRPTPSESTLPPEFDRLTEVYKLLQTEYVAPDRLNWEILTDGAIRGMLDALSDPYTSYIQPDAYGLHMEDLAGSFGGIGATVSVRDGQVIVVAPLNDTPAARAGLRSGDVILMVDGVSTEGLSLSEVIIRIRGEAGTTVRLLLQSADTREPAEMELVRDRITVESVEARRVSGGIPLIRLSTFSRSTGKEMEEALGAIDLSSVAGLIIDLRDNGGGLLEATIEAVQPFLDKGVVLYQVDREGRETERENPTQGAAAQVPLAILVNRNSASASEVFAGAIQAHDRGPLIGERTFGKGSVGLMFSLTGGGGLTLTTARWLTPERQLIEGLGLDPDIKVVNDLATPGDEALQRAIDYILFHGRT